MSNHDGQEAGQNCGFDPSRNKNRRLRVVTVPGAQEQARRNGVETETNKDKSSSCDVAVTCDDVRCFS